MLILKRYAVILAVLLITDITNVAYPLSLGELKVNANVSFQAQAEIEMLSVNPGYSIESYKARLASPAIYQRLGLERPAELEKIRMSSTYRNGKPVILLNSGELALTGNSDLVIEVVSPGDTTLKKFQVNWGNKAAAVAEVTPPQVTQLASETALTVLTHSEQQPIKPQQLGNQPVPHSVAVNAAPTSVDVRRQVKPRPVAATRQPDRPKTVPAMPSKQRFYTVRKGDTLFKISARLKYKGVTTEQMMLAFYQENKQRFARGAIDKLSVGDKLRVPVVQDVKAVSRSSSAAFKQKVEQAYKKKKRLAAKSKAPKPVVQKRKVKADASRQKIAKAKIAQQKKTIQTNEDQKLTVAGTGTFLPQDSEFAGVHGNKGLQAGVELPVAMSSRMRLLQDELFETNRSLEKEQASNRGLRELLRRKNRQIWHKGDLLQACEDGQQTTALIRASLNPFAGKGVATHTSVQRSVAQAEKQTGLAGMTTPYLSRWFAPLSDKSGWLLMAVIFLGLLWVMVRNQRKTETKQPQVDKKGEGQGEQPAVKPAVTLLEASIEQRDSLPIHANHDEQAVPESSVVRLSHLRENGMVRASRADATPAIDYREVEGHIKGLRHSLAALDQNLRDLSALR